MLNIKKISPLYIPILYNIYIYITYPQIDVDGFDPHSWRHVEALKVGFRAERPEIWRGGLEPQPTPLSLVNRWLRPCEWIHLDPKKGGMDPGMKNLDLFLCWAFASKCKTGHRISLKQSCIAMVYWQKWWRAHRNSGTHLDFNGKCMFLEHENQNWPIKSYIHMKPMGLTSSLTNGKWQLTQWHCQFHLKALRRRWAPLLDFVKSLCLGQL